MAATATRPLGKRLWQAIVVAKVSQQAAVLALAGKPSGGVAGLAGKVRSGGQHRGPGGPALLAAAHGRRLSP